MSRSYWFIVFLLIFFCSQHSYSKEINIPIKVSKKNAYHLAVIAYSNQKMSKYLEFDHVDDTGLPFFIYVGINPPPYEGNFDFVGVNPWTGDVWTLNGCYKLNTPKSLRIQAKIKTRFTSTELEEYDYLSQLKPFCIFGDPDVDK